MQNSMTSSPRAGPGSSSDLLSEWSWQPARSNKQGKLPSFGNSANVASMIDDILDYPAPIWNQLSAIVRNQEDLGFRILLGLESGDESPQRYGQGSRPSR